MTQNVIENCPICNKTGPNHSRKELLDCFEKFLDKGTLVPSPTFQTKDETKMIDDNYG